MLFLFTSDLCHRYNICKLIVCFNLFVGGFIRLLLFPDRHDITDVLLKIALKHHNPLYLTLNVCADKLSNNVGLVHVNIYASTDTVTVLLVWLAKLKVNSNKYLPFISMIINTTNRLSHTHNCETNLPAVVSTNRAVSLL